jgi:DNA-binding transcriptional regulator YdaS (Cro superfamily)
METKIISPIGQAAILLGGGTALAKTCGVSAPAVHKWLKQGRLPRTEWTGETDYASRIVEALGGRMTREQLLERPAASSGNA